MKTHGAGYILGWCLGVVLLQAVEALAASEEGVNQETEEVKPLWEVNLLAAAATFPHYRGSDESEQYYLPGLFVVYRGEHLRADRDGIDGVWEVTPRLEFKLSFSAKPPVDDTEARRGMDRLDPQLETGGAVEYYFLREHPEQIALRLSLRKVAAVDKWDVSDEGMRGQLQFIVHNDDWFRDSHWSGGISLNAEWGSQEYHEYFYGVSPRKALDSRPAYDAEAGYGGVSVSGSMFYRINDRLSTGGFVHWDHIGGAVFEDSPLIRRENNFTGGWVIVWRMAASEKRVGRDRLR